MGHPPARSTPKHTGRLRRLGCALLLLAGALSAAPVIPDLRVRTWTIADGLPGNEIRGMDQDRDGYLWIGHVNGLVRFDGVHFQKIVPDETPNPFAKGVLKVLCQADGSVLVALREGGLLRLGPEGTRRLQIPAEHATRWINTLFRESAEVTWVGMSDGYALRLSGEQVQVFGPAQGLNPQQPLSFALDETGHTWIASGGLLARVDGDTLSPVPGAPRDQELKICSARAGGPWVATGTRLLKAGPDGFSGRATLAGTLGSHYIQVLREDARGTLWIGTRSRGVHRLTAAGRLEPVRTHDDTNSLLDDSEGNLWVGTNGGGIARLRPGLLHCFDKGDGLLETYSYTVCEDSQGVVWLANRDGGLATITDAGVAYPKIPDKWRSSGMISVSPDGNGGIWATNSLELQHVRLTPAPVWEKPAPPFPLNKVRILFTSRSGELWFALDPGVLGHLGPGGFEFFGKEAGYEGGEIRSIAEAPDGALWVGNAKSQLHRLENGRLTRVPTSENGDSGAYQALVFDAEGRLWIATQQGGLLRLEDGVLGRIDSEQGLPDSNISLLLDDGRGSLWFGYPRGLYNIPFAELAACLAGRTRQVQPRLLGRDQGLPQVACLSFFQPACWRARNGLLWFATRQGTVAIDPSRESTPARPPRASVRLVRTDERPLPFAKTHQLKADFGKLELVFSTLCLSSPDQVRTRYRLEGFDSAWISASASDTAKYPRLEPGTYRFEVAASLGGVDSEGPADVVTIIIQPLWWQSPCFRLAAAAALCGLLVLVVRAWSHRRLRRNLEKLERDNLIASERARIARNIHDDVGASLTRISLLTQAARADADKSGRMEEIYQAVSEVTLAMNEIVWAVNPKYDDLDSLIYYLTSFAQKFLASAGIRCRLDIPDLIPPVTLSTQLRHHLFLCCREALNNAVRHSRASEVELRLKVGPDTLELGIRDNGRGFDPSAPPAAAGPQAGSGNGLPNLRRRLTEIGGILELRSRAGEGTDLVFKISLHVAAPRPDTTP